MPIYEYRCDACGHTVEAFQKFSDAPLETCEVCGGRLTKVLHPAAIHFKGSGFYTTDYGRGSGKRPGADAGKAHDGDAAAATKASGDGKADAGKAGDGKAGGGKASGGKAGDGAGSASSAGKGG